MGLFLNILGKFLEKHEDKILKAVQKNSGGTIEDIDTIVNDYVYLIKKIYKGSGISHIELTPDPYVILIDGENWFLLYKQKQKSG